MGKVFLIGGSPGNANPSQIEAGNIGVPLRLIIDLTQTSVGFWLPAKRRLAWRSDGL
jgi:hypothetical protein